MGRKLGPLSAVVFAAVCQAGWTTPAMAEDARAQAVRAEIQQTLNKVMQLYRQKASGQEVAEAFYEDDAMAIGEGPNGLPHDRKAIDSYMIENVEEERTCVLSIVEPIRYSDRLASAYVSAHCPDAKPAEHVDARMFLVFHKGKKGWRVTQEMYIWGSF